MRRGRAQSGGDPGRAFRLRDAAVLGLRAVPSEPDPERFPARVFACELAPRRCPECSIAKCARRAEAEKARAWLQTHPAERPT